MAGEMHYIKQNGQDSDGTVWELHAKIAKAVGGKLMPFDTYQGPYIIIGKDLLVGHPPYQQPVQKLGITRLWVIPDQEEPDTFGRIYNEATDKVSGPFLWDDYEGACYLAKELLKLGY